MADFIPLDEAAELLNVSVEELKEMRSRGEIFGVRDGSSWKFKTEEIERVRSELAGDVLDDDPGGSSILVSERAVGSAGSKLGSTLSGEGDGDSDLSLSPDDQDSDELSLESDVSLIPDPGSGSGVRLVNKNVPAPAEDDEEVLELPNESDSGSSLMLSDLNLDGLSSTGSGSTPSAINADSDVLAGVSDMSGGSGGQADLIRGDSDPDLQLDEDESDLVLGGEDSALSLKQDSGLNLKSPADSGLSLEEELIDLSGASISGLGLSDEIGSDVGSNPSGSGIGGGSGAGISGIDFASAEDFQLSPSGGMDFDDDSGSQVIELEDSADFAGVSPDGFGDMGGQDPGAVGFDEADQAVSFDSDAGVVPGAYAAGPAAEFSWWEVGLLLMTIVILGFAGILMTDIARNMWAAAEGSDANMNSWLSDAVAKSIPGSGT